MMGYLRTLLIAILLAAAAFYLLEKSTEREEASSSGREELQEKQSQLKSKTAPDMTKNNVPMKGDLYQWIGKSADVVTEELGEPSRRDKSAYGYTWWVYNENPKEYFQLGVKDDEVITLYAIGSELDLSPLKIGQSYEKVKEEFTFNEEVTYEEGVTHYTYLLDNEALQSRPLVKLTDNLFLQIYFDTFTKKISSIRVITGDTLLQHQPYAMQYLGELPENRDFTDEEWAEIESGMEQQIFDITNIMRQRHGKSTLEKEKAVNAVAYSHSRDMAENDYFSHESQNGDGLKERLAMEELFYLTAGENIAAQYDDAPAVMEGWLNSEGHRESLLREGYTHLGVGVYRFYYTQNFLEKL
ncbi:CAP domain-containing protein [Lentibacillus sediminis]|uniref:CAP domain-containing protein n=1 Tax=Lentibacillus sediminis TaxID=1940529 RepID=UPI001EFDD376|nr:CAP domain-containing protein [Lentibacillus sediminis]